MQLKISYRKLQVFAPSNDFQAAVKVVEVPFVDPAPDQIRIKQLFAGVNATDLNIAATRYFFDGKLPFDIGFEAVGLVDAIGSSVPADKFSKGQPVLVFESGRKGQGFAEYSYKTVEALFPIPAAKPEFLATLINGLTAAIALDKVGHIKPGDKVLITAAAGGTGQIAVQWAKQLGAFVIGITSSDEKAKYLKEIGADDVINYRETSLDEALKESYPDGIDVIWETIGDETFKILFNHLGLFGRLILIGSIDTYKEAGFKDVTVPNLNSSLIFGAKSLIGFNVFSYQSYFAEYLPKLITGIAKGTIKVRVDFGEKAPGGRFFGVDQVYRAQEWLHSGKNIGKVVVELQKP